MDIRSDEATLIDGLCASDPDQRLDAIAGLRLRATASAAEALLAVLADPDVDVADRAARAVYDFPDPEQLFSKPENAARLREGVRQGHRTAAAVLLLGYAPGPETEPLLDELLRNQPQEPAKLDSWNPDVELRWPVFAALSRLGGSDARTTLLEGLESAPPEVFQFFLGVLREVDAAEVLQVLSRALDDKTPISGGAPSGAEPQRRLCDLAVDAFSSRLNLPLSFPRDESVRYSDEQIAEVRRLIQSSVPQ